MKVLIINGPNLNMLGKREPEIYGSQTLEQINADVKNFALIEKIETEFFQSNCEGEIIDKIHRAECPIVINAGAYTHYSYAIADALKCVSVKKIEVHMSNIFAREQFRSKSVLSEVCDGVVCGFGSASYKLAILALKL